MDRFLAEQAAGDHGGPVLYATEWEAARARELGVARAVAYGEAEAGESRG